jgi:hypothetical protein
VQRIVGKLQESVTLVELLCVTIDRVDDIRAVGTGAGRFLRAAGITLTSMELIETV